MTKLTHWTPQQQASVPFEELEDLLICDHQSMLVQNELSKLEPDELERLQRSDTPQARIHREEVLARFMASRDN